MRIISVIHGYIHTCTHTNIHIHKYIAVCFLSSIYQDSLKVMNDLVTMGIPAH